MRRITIMFLTMAVTLLLVAAVAGAVPPGFCDGDKVHPQCPPPSSSTTTTTTTTTTAPPELDDCLDWDEDKKLPGIQRTLEGTATTSFECLWKPINDGSPVATVRVTNITGALSGPPTLFVRDDSPGDICVLAQSDEDWVLEGESGAPEYVASFDLVYDEVPVPTEEDPDVLDYGAWLGEDYWTLVLDPGADPPKNEPGTHWCAPQDPVLWSIREDNNGGALHFMVNFNGKKWSSFRISMSPG